MLARGRIPDLPRRNSVLIIVYRAAHTIWMLRNNVYKEGAQYDDESAIRMLKKSLSLRIRADHARKDYKEFKKMWDSSAVIDMDRTNEEKVMTSIE